MISKKDYTVSILRWHLSQFLLLNLEGSRPCSTTLGRPAGLCIAVGSNGCDVYFNPTKPGGARALFLFFLYKHPANRAPQIGREAEFGICSKMLVHYTNTL